MATDNGSDRLSRGFGRISVCNSDIGFIAFMKHFGV